MLDPDHPKLQVLVGALGRFHMFDLTKQLLRLGQRATLVTGYPRWKVDPEIRRNSVCFPNATYVDHLRRRAGVGRSLRWEDRVHRYLDHRLATWAARHAEEIDLMDAMSGIGLEGGRILKERGTAWVVNRSSSHLLFQKEVLEEEHRLWGLSLPLVRTTAGLERELSEYREADAVVVPSEFCRETFVSRGIDSEKVFKCPFGVDVSLFRPTFGLRGDRFRVGFVGTYSVRKGIQYLFEAIRPLVERRHCECWLIGGPSEEARPLLARNVDLYIDKGFVPRKRLCSLYSACDVLVLPSVEEGLAVVQGQAMACATPVIATKNAGAAELFTDGVEGFIVPIRDPTAIREKIEWMIDNPGEREAMGSAALARARALGGWDSYGEACLKMYRTILARQRPAPKRLPAN